MELTDAPGKTHAVDKAQSDKSERETPAARSARGTTGAPTPPQQLVKLLGFSSFRVLVLVLVLEVVVAWLVLTLTVAAVSSDLPVTTFWQRVQALVSSRQTTLAFLFVLASAVVVPTFIWFHVSFLWVLVLWRRWRASRAQRQADGFRP